MKLTGRFKLRLLNKTLRIVHKQSAPPTRRKTLHPVNTNLPDLTRGIMPRGTCKLTGDVGPMIKAHILPGALCDPRPANEPFIQVGVDFRPTTRRTGWYDQNIVTQKGEDILTSYDTWAITELRRQKLVWSGWGQDESLVAIDHEFVPDFQGNGCRKLERFLISLHRSQRQRSSSSIPEASKGRRCGRWRSRDRGWCARRPFAGAPSAWRRPFRSG